MDARPGVAIATSTMAAITNLDKFRLMFGSLTLWGVGKGAANALNCPGEWKWLAETAKFGKSFSAGRPMQGSAGSRMAGKEAQNRRGLSPSVLDLLLPARPGILLLIRKRIFYCKMGAVLRRGGHENHGEFRVALKRARAKLLELTHFRARRRRHFAENDVGAALGLLNCQRSRTWMHTPT